MPALLMYYWQMKLHCKLFNLNNLDASDVKILVFAILYVKYEAFQAHNASLDPPSQEPQTQSIQAGPEALNPLCPPWSLVTSCGLMIPEKVYDEQ